MTSEATYRHKRNGAHSAMVYPAGRLPPSPNSVLDRTALENALHDACIFLKSRHIDAFYKALHEANYPSLQEFAASNRCRRPTITYRKGGRKPIETVIPPKLLKFVSKPANGFVTLTSKVLSVRKNSSGKSAKMSIQLHDGEIVEVVVMRFETDYHGFASVSVASQVGCTVGCSFCPEATNEKMNRCLYTCEILEQVIHASRFVEYEGSLLKERGDRDKVRNVTFMGSGEPLLNYDHVVACCKSLADVNTWDLQRGRITIPTIGVTPRIYQLARDLPEVVLSVGIHASNQEMRSRRIPIARKYPLGNLILATEFFVRSRMRIVNNDGHRLVNDRRKSREMGTRHATIEYIMVEDETCALTCARELGELCQGMDVIVNLVPYIRKSEYDSNRCPKMSHIKEFMSIMWSYNVQCRIHLPMGVDIPQASKELVVQSEKPKRRRKKVKDTIQYTDDTKQAIDFWKTLDVARKAADRKRRKQRKQESRVRRRAIDDAKRLLVVVEQANDSAPSRLCRRSDQDLSMTFSEVTTGEDESWSEFSGADDSRGASAHSQRRLLGSGESASNTSWVHSWENSSDDDDQSWFGELPEMRTLDSYLAKRSKGIDLDGRSVVTSNTGALSKIARTSDDIFEDADSQTSWNEGGDEERNASFLTESTAHHMNVMMDGDASVASLSLLLSDLNPKLSSETQTSRRTPKMKARNRGNVH